MGLESVVALAHARNDSPPVYEYPTFWLDKPEWLLSNFPQAERARHPR